MAIYLDTVSLYDQKFELGDKNPLEGCAHQSSLLNDLWIMGRDSPSLKSKVKLPIVCPFYSGIAQLFG